MCLPPGEKLPAGGTALYEHSMQRSTLLDHKLIPVHLTRPSLRPGRILAFLVICLICVLGLTGCQTEATDPVEPRASEAQAETLATNQTETESLATSQTETESLATNQTEVEPEANNASASTSPDATAPSPGTDKAALATQAEGEPDNTATEAGQIQELKFSDMYEVGNSSRGLRFSDHFKSLDGQQVKMNGFMAPPLKPVFNFFVLSKEPMAICPFCSSDADWPADIVAVYVEKGTKSVSNDSLLTIVGRLELGSFTDEETGFVSQARIYAEEIIHNR